MEMGEYLYLYASSEEEETYRILINHNAICFPYFFPYFCLLLSPRIRYFHCLHLTGGHLVFELLSEGGTRSFLALPFPPTHEEYGQWPPS